MSSDAEDRNGVLTFQTLIKIKQYIIPHSALRGTMYASDKVRKIVIAENVDFLLDK